MYHRINNNRMQGYSSLLSGRRPFARAELRGSAEYKDIAGTVDFFATPLGIVVSTQVSGLPYDREEPCSPQIYGFHIHNAGRCTGSAESPFEDAGAHFDKRGCAHPSHSGDLPPLFGNRGYAWSAVLTDRLSPEDVMGRSVIVHSGADDLATDPSGDSGRRIACGIIMGV
ncbi:MAG: superoxide dismutase family protein [Clostridia bacterium]|nr:superoxide dismutase family protein [Clostridia bacterium]